MLVDRKVSLRPILESSEGIHLTAYLVNRGDLVDLKVQLRQTLEEAYEWLNGVQTIDERNRFLEPLDGLLNDARIMKNMKGNIGLFRTKDTFRVLNVPVQVERQCHIASSFHVKPLLRWLQSDRDFLLVGLRRNSAQIYLGNQTSFHKVDSVQFSLESSREDEVWTWLNEWFDRVTYKARPILYVAGEASLTKEFFKRVKYREIVKTPIAGWFHERNVGDICTDIRRLLNLEARQRFERTLLEFRVAEDLSLTKKNIHEIAKSAVRGRIKKLVIAEDLNIYGKVDRKTGGLAIHPFDLDHEDDDILDDLAQTVLAHGGEVFVARRSEIPKSRAALAIVDDVWPRHEDIGPMFDPRENFQERSAL